MKYFKDLPFYEHWNSGNYDKAMKVYKTIPIISRGSECQRKAPNRLYCRWGDTQDFACLEAEDSNSSGLYSIENLYDKWEQDYKLKQYIRNGRSGGKGTNLNEVEVIIHNGEDFFCIWLANCKHSVKIESINQYRRIGLINIWCIEDNIDVENTVQCIVSFAHTGNNVPIIVYVLEEAFTKNDSKKEFIGGLKSENIGVVLVDGVARILGKNNRDEFYERNIQKNNYENYLIKSGFIV